MLEDNIYVRCLLVDFSKAFDSIDHCILINKLKGYNIAGNVIQWIVSFLSDLDQFTKFGGKSSIISIINRSIVQGSEIGSMLFIIFIADLRSGGESNKTVQYADDASMPVSEKTDVQIKYKFSKVVAWASKNKLGINMAKTMEIVFHRPHPKNLLLPTTLPGIERVLSAKFLGVWLQSNFGMSIQVDSIARICKQRLYILTQLRKQGLSQSFIKVVFLMQSLSHELHMRRLPGDGTHPEQTLAWKGYASRADIDLIQKLFVKARHWGIVNRDYNLEEILDNCDKALFVASQSSKNCLYSRFRKKDNKLLTIVLRRRGHKKFCTSYY